MKNKGLRGANLENKGFGGANLIKKPLLTQKRSKKGFIKVFPALRRNGRPELQAPQVGRPTAGTMHGSAVIMRKCHPNGAGSRDRMSAWWARNQCATNRQPRTNK